MSGIYGNSPEDRYWSGELDKHLERQYGDEEEEYEPDVDE